MQAMADRHADRSTCLALAPLPDARSLEMVEQLLATKELPESLRTLIVNKADGNPFFVEEVLRALIERGALIRTNEDAGWMATSLIETVAIPNTLHGLLMSRLDRLPDQTRWVAQQASVIGRVFLYRVLLRMAENMPGDRRRPGAPRAGRVDPSARPRLGDGVRLQACVDPGGRLPESRRAAPTGATPARRRDDGGDLRQPTGRVSWHPRRALSARRGLGACV